MEKRTLNVTIWTNGECCNDVDLATTDQPWKGKCGFLWFKNNGEASCSALKKPLFGTHTVIRHAECIANALPKLNKVQDEPSPEDQLDEIPF